jgi:hypothetical protein
LDPREVLDEPKEDGSMVLISTLPHIVLT